MTIVDVETRHAANQLAGRLRRRGVTYSCISVVIDELYGIKLSEHTWRHQLRSQGCPPVPRGLGLANFRRGEA